MRPLRHLLYTLATIKIEKNTQENLPKNFPFNKMKNINFYLSFFELEEEISRMVNCEIVNLHFTVPIVIILCLQ